MRYASRMGRARGIKWTNKSVLALAGDDDPVGVVQKTARDFVLKARESGWEGPPFNPLKLADFLRVQVAANGSIKDARVFETSAGPRIEYNPQQPRERVRFSIAHELAHLLFPDWKEEVRNRSGERSGDHWQLEMLCNLAASEFVLPIGSLPSSTEVAPIEDLMIQRRAFDVSAEAFLIRLARIAEAPVAVFFAARQQDGGDRYRIDYVVSSPSAPDVHLTGLQIPAGSRIKACTAVGYTERGTEDWPTGTPLKIEFVGITPYPGHTYPRVAGLIRYQERRAEVRPIRYVHGTVLEPRGAGLRVICQIVNDKAIKWGGGVARNVARKYPHAEASFSEKMLAMSSKERLGTVIFTEADENVVVASIIAQEGFGPSLFPRLRYAAVEAGIRTLAEFAANRGATIHMPRIGTGAAGGDWNVIEEMVEEYATRVGVEVTVYDLPPKRNQLDLFA